MIADICEGPNSILIQNEPFEDYLAQSATHLTSHQLADFRRSPKLYHRKKTGQIVDLDKRVYKIGRALHTLTLEGREMFDSQFCCEGPINPKTGEQYGTSTKAWGEYEAAIGKVCLGDVEYAQVMEMHQSIRDNRTAAKLIDDLIGWNEVVIRTQMNGLAVQARIDRIARNEAGETVFIDLKTTANLDTFLPQIKRYGYAHQIAFYGMVFTKAATRVKDISIPTRSFLIVAEKADPFRSTVVQLCSDLLRPCAFQNWADIERLSQCYAANEWPSGFPDSITYDLEQFEKESV